MIFWVTKLRIRHIALKDGKGQYGTSLIRRQRSLNGDSSAKIGFEPSDWMKSLAISYKNVAERLSNDKKNIVILYTQIRQCYTRSLEADDEFSHKASTAQSIARDIDAEITKLEAEIAEKDQLLSDFHQGKPLPNGLTPRKLISSKADLDRQYSQKQAQKKSAADLSSIQSEHEKFEKELRDTVIQLESDFSIEIDSLYKRIRKVELRYNEQISYYWQKLCKYVQKNRISPQHGQTIKITESVKQLGDIASLCGVSVFSQEDLFKSERKFMNMTVNKTMKINYKV